jgi:type IV secretory pathway VirB3-like protein
MSNDIGSPILRAVAAPPRLLHAAPKLVAAEAALCLGIWLFLLEPLVAIVAFLILHVVAMVLTSRDPHLVEVLTARSRCPRTRNLRFTRGHRYVP